MKCNEIQPGVVCRHHSGRVYTILHITNESHPSKKFPPTVVYIGANGEIWSRPTWEFIKKFKVLFNGENLA